MEKAIHSSEINYCSSCLCNSEDYKLQDFVIKHTQFWQIFEVGTIKLCYVCRRLAQHAELFIQNVQSNQILLQNCIGDISTIKEAVSRLKNPITLNHLPLDPIDILGNGNIPQKRVRIKLVKVPKQEKMDVEMQTNTIKTERTDDGYENSGAEMIEELEENGEPTAPVKIEKDLPTKELKRVRKRPVSAVIIMKDNDRTVAKRLKLTKNNDTDQMKYSHITPKSSIELQNKMHSIKKISISEEEYFEERRKHALQPRYLNCSYKCESCIKGFNFKDTYDSHMKRHTDEMGAHECCYCKVRLKTEKLLHYHTECHQIRYKCTICGLFRACRTSMLDHHNIVHRNGEIQLPCPYCDKTFSRRFTRKKHIENKHLTKERVKCAHCQKTYGSKQGLKTHMIASHPEMVSCEIKQFGCEQCGYVCRTAGMMKAHRVTHSSAREFYCVECDKAFKTKGALSMHLTTTRFHANKAEAPLACDQCEKRFWQQRDLEGHVNTVHLDIKPYKCDQCNKSYTCKSALGEHRRTVHEGVKKPLKYCCEYCDKRFNSGGVLKKHIRTHTGERPYQCDKCPAQFTQSGALATHNKLIHQRLTRDGKPK